MWQVWILLIIVVFFTFLYCTSSKENLTNMQNSRNSQKSIFVIFPVQSVNIAAECIHQLYVSAEFPKRIFVGILDVAGSVSTVLFSQFRDFGSQVRSFCLKGFPYLGDGFARRIIIEQLYQDEDFVFFEEGC